MIIQQLHDHRVVLVNQVLVPSQSFVYVCLLFVELSNLLVNLCMNCVVLFGRIRFTAV